MGAETTTATTEAPANTPGAALETPAPTAPDAAAPKARKNGPKERLRNRLAPALRAALEKHDGEVRSEPSAPAAVSEEPPAPASAEADGEQITFGADEPAAPAILEDAGAAEHGLTEEQLKALGEDVRKKLSERDKEHAKLRKREQANEQKLAELQAALDEAAKAREDALEKLNAAQTRGGLAGNVFASWQDAKAVAAWGGSGKEILGKFHKLSIAHAAGEEIPDELLEHELPNGRKMKLDMSAYDAAQSWVEDATGWFAHDEQVTKNRAKAKPVETKHASLTGYSAARQAYMDDPHVGTRLDELIAKAAFYDVLESRRGQVHFPGKAGAANSAPFSPEAENRNHAPKPTPTPPRETAASSPRLAPAAAAGNAERSQAKAQAMKSGDPEDIRAALLAARRSRGGE